MPENETCSTCNFWCPADPDDDAGEALGQCRASPPAPEAGGEFEAPRARWPLVLAGEWCGGWQERM